MNKQSSMYYRIKLLFEISEKMKSESTMLKILNLVWEAPDGSKESTAESIVKKMENCTTEEEVVKVLELV